MKEKKCIHLREKIFLERHPFFDTKERTEPVNENIMQMIEDKLEIRYGGTRRKLKDLTKINAYSYTIGILGKVAVYDLPVDSGENGKSIDIIADDAKKILEIFSILTETDNSRDAKKH